MTRIKFETAALTDAIKKAEKIAPSSAGQAFDKAAGIVLEINPNSEAPAIVKATDLNIYSMEWLDCLESEGPATAWRLPSRLLANVMSSLPIGSGRVVEFWEEKKGVYPQVHAASGRTKVRFNLMDVEYYPRWSAFDPAMLSPVMDVGGRIAQVEWASANTPGEAIGGVNLDGEYAVATDKYRMARVPLKIGGIDEPVTIPPGPLSQLLKQTGEVQMGFDGTQMLIMPDEHSQLRVILFGLAYPSLKRPMSIELPSSIKTTKESLLGILQRAASFTASSDRDPFLQCFIGKEEFAVMMHNAETGLLGDVLEIPGQALHDRREIRFTSKNIINPIEKSPSAEIELFYDPENSRAPVRIEGGSGYQAWTMPRVQTDTSS